MGAESWESRTKWIEDPVVALRLIQEAELTKYLSLEDEIAQGLRHYRQYEEAADDLGDMILQPLAVFKRLSKETVPTDFEGKLNVLRLIRDSDGSGIGNVLDIRSISSEGNTFVAQLLNEREMLALLGTSQPGDDWLNYVTAEFRRQVGRADSICFPIYDETGTIKVEWCFFGFSLD